MNFKIGDCVIKTRKKQRDSLLLESILKDTNSDFELNFLKQQKEGIYIVTKPSRLFGTYFQTTLNGIKFTKLRVKDYQLATLEKKRRYELKKAFIKIYKNKK